jgi:hypothetical protein
VLIPLISNEQSDAAAPDRSITARPPPRRPPAFHEFHAGILLPGITMNTSVSNYHPIRQMQLGRFDGKAWQNFGEIIAAQ